MNNVQVLLPAGTNPQPYVAWPDFQRNSILVRTVGVSQYDSLQMKFQRRWHKGLAFLLAYTLSEAKTNAGDSLSGGLVGGLRGPDLVGFDLDKRHPPGGLPYQALARVQRQLRSAGQGHPAGRLARELGDDALQRSASDGRLRGGDQRGTNCYALLVGDPYEGAGTVENIYNAAAFATPTPVATIGQTDFSPLGGEGTQVTGPGLKQLDFGLAKSFNVWGQRRVEFRIETFNLTNTPAFELPPNTRSTTATRATSPRSTACATRRGRCSSA